MSKSENVNFRMTPSEKEVIAASAEKSNMSISEYVLQSALNSKNIKIIDNNAKIAKHLCQLTTEINLLKLNNKINFKNIDREVDNIWQCLKW